MSDTGVVDPIRVPLSVQTYVRAMPRIALAFIVLVVVDVVGRWLGVIEPGIYLSTDAPTTFLTAFLPRDALILLPAAITLRRPDAETATPWILRGAILVALVELLGSPTRALISGLVNGGDESLLFWVGSVQLALAAVGWLTIGRGLAALNPAPPTATVAGLANLAALLVASTLLVSLIAIAFGPTNIANAADPTTSGPLSVNHAVGAFNVLAWAYLIRSVLRGLDDPSRSLRVTRQAAVGALLSASMTFFVSLLGLAFTLNPTFAIQVGNDAAIWAYFVGDAIGISLIVLALGLGFADPLRPMPKDWDKAAG